MYSGNILTRQGKREEAFEEYRLGLKMNPDLAKAHCGLGFLLKDQGKLAEATEEFHRALKINPDDVETHRGLGLVLSYGGKLAEALEEFRAAVRLAPGSADAHCNVGSALVEMGKPAEAIEELHAALQIDPDNAMYHMALGAALAKQEKLAEAIEEFRLVSRSIPTTWPPRPTLVFCCAAKASWQRPLRNTASFSRGIANCGFNNQLAWLLANAADVQLRQPAEAVQLATSGGTGAHEWNPLEHTGRGTAATAMGKRLSTH